MPYSRFKRVLAISAISLLMISFFLSQVITTRRYASMVVTIHFDMNLRFSDFDIETNFSYANESTVYDFSYTQPNFENEIGATEQVYEIFNIMINGTNFFYWNSIPLEVRSEGYLRHVFFNIQFGTYDVIVSFRQLTYIEPGSHYDLTMRDNSEELTTNYSPVFTKTLGIYALEYTI